MTILVLSDSHGNPQAVQRAVEANSQASVVIHLGDGAADVQKVAAMYPDREFHVVRGNGDYDREIPLNETLTIHGHTLFLTHGWAEHVKSGLLTLCYTARERGAAAALFGHTHTPLVQYHAGMLLFNPGSAGGYRPTYGLLEISKDGIFPRILSL